MTSKAMPTEPHCGFFTPDGETRVTRHHLPHWHQDDVFAFLTWRLADALDAKTVERIRHERQRWSVDDARNTTWAKVREERILFSARLDKLLDAGTGSCFLSKAEPRSVVSAALEYFDGSRYDLEGYVVMPNHVHALIKLTEDAELPKLLHSWKSYTAKRLADYATDPTHVWQHGYWDRLVRSPKHLAFYRRYVEENPVRAGPRSGSFNLWLSPRAPFSSW